MVSIPVRDPGPSERLEQRQLIEAEYARKSETLHIIHKLLQAHALMLGLGLDCTLDQRPRLVPPDAALDAARAAIRHACHATHLPF